MTHTPGPWQSYWNGHYFDVSSGNQLDPTIACVHHNVFLKDGNPEDNARLIAAAPDLLEALKGLLACPDHEGWQAEAVEAIAKAEGK